MASLQSSGCLVLGLSEDKGANLQKFADGENLFFSLCDADFAVHHAYGTYGEKSRFGKKVMGVIRSTLIIDETGVLTHALYSFKATGHVVSLKGKLKL